MTESEPPVIPDHRQHPSRARHARGGPSRRGLLGLGAATLLGAGVYSTIATPAKSLGAHLGPGPDTGGPDGLGDQPGDPGPSVDNPRLIGDGSTADTGPQP
ncbi:hypothetical protein E1265_31135, partial [Streptomyces sp. 8K308]